MLIPVKKLKSGFSMPVFGLGTWGMGGNDRRNPLNNDRKDIQAIRNALSSGITHIDTAEMYAGGHAEELVGEAIKDYNRKKLFIVSKVWPTHLHYDDVLNSCANSLKRLKINYLDLYLIHAANPDIPIRETMKAMDRLLKEGLIKNIGVSNFSVKSFQKAQSATENKIVNNQLHYNLLIREVEKRGLLSFCQNEDIMLTAWRPVQKGKFSTESYQIVDELAQKYHKTPVQIAINWLLSQKNVVTVSKMSHPRHLQENLGAVGWEMEIKDIEKLRQEFPDQADFSDSTSVAII